MHAKRPRRLGTVGEVSTDRDDSVFARVAGMRLERDGTMSIEFVDGRAATASLGRHPFEPTSAIASSTFLPSLRWLHLETVRGDHILIEVPAPADMAPLEGRPSIYLDQNHWSTLTNSIHAPERVRDADELVAARRLIELTLTKRVVLPMSSAHMSETCKQADGDERYRRALTISQLSAGWQLRDPLALRRFELRQALTIRYRHCCLVPSPAVTLEPNAVHSGRESDLDDVATDLPPEARWAVHAIRCIGGIVDTMLDAEHLPMPGARGWVDELQRFASFLRDNPTGKELKRRRTHAKFIVDLGRELPEEACRAGVTPEQMSDWTLNHSEEDLPGMPALGLFREILHEKLCDAQLRWFDNDLVDMMYLSAGAAYCDHFAGERTHTSHIANGLRRLGLSKPVHRSLRSLVEHL